jgi:hypothetical protein
MTDDFLTTEQVQKLTGKVRISAQRRYLRERNVAHEVNGRGEVLVLWSQVELMMGIKRPTEAAPEPNWSALYGPSKTAA